MTLLFTLLFIAPVTPTPTPSTTTPPLLTHSARSNLQHPFCLANYIFSHYTPLLSNPLPPLGSSDGISFPSGILSRILSGPNVNIPWRPYIFYYPQQECIHGHTEPYRKVCFKIHFW